MIYLIDESSTPVPNDFTLVAVKGFKSLQLDRISGLYVLLNASVDVKELKDLLVKVAEVKTFRGFSIELVFLIDENYNIDTIKRVVDSLPLNYTYVIKSTADPEKLLTSDVINRRESRIVVVDD
ncbi:hypothetical protein [Stygiolobus caldivivus]|uniref:Uncharacterized protein n=1 Tax=Stygiolobus caldivivus TaxID=2824673 RepID=A0A8D5ZD04_9CREN|nr:hypothetical protein [Stygiolobus caldivivus]BCU68848.1 hypothetical protein KN1_01450 [Stygiolobus caldivivus]